MTDRSTTRRRVAQKGLCFFVAVCSLVMILTGTVAADWLAATGDGVDLWIVRPVPEAESITKEPGLKILHHRDLEEPINRIYRVTTLSGRLAPGGVASAGEKLWMIYENLSVVSLPVTLSDRTQHERYGNPHPETALPTPAKLWSVTANQDGPWALLRIDGEQALAALQTPPDASQPSPASAPSPVPTTLPSTTAPSVTGEAPATQPFKATDALVRLKRNRWTIEPLPDDWLPEARNFVLMLDAKQDYPLLVSLRPDPERSPAGTTAVVYSMSKKGWESQSYALPNAGDNPAAANEAIPLAISQQLAIASLSFTPSAKSSVAATQAATTLPSAGAAKAVAPTGTLTLNMAILDVGDIHLPGGRHAKSPVSSITPLVLSQDKPAAAAMVPLRSSLAIIVSDAEGDLNWGIVDLHGKLESAFTALTPRDEQDLSEQSVWLVPVLLIAAAVLIMFARMRKDSPASVPKFPEGYVVADFLRRGLAFFFDLTPCVLLTTMIFHIEAPVMIGQWLHFNVGWDVMFPRLTVVVLFALHTGISEAVSGKSMGKAILGLKVISTNGLPPTLGQIVIRNVLKIFDLIAWPLIFLPLIRPYAQRLGDLAAKTVVVMPEPSDEDEDDDSI